MSILVKADRIVLYSSDKNEMSDLISQAATYFASVVGEQHVRRAPEDLQHWGRDWLQEFKPHPAVVVLPATRQEVQQIVAYCHRERLPYVPSGGRTGLVGGAVAARGEVVISLGRMSKIREINRTGMFAVVDAGVTTQQLQEAAAEAGVMFAINLTARGSAHIGGNISTNAGGTQFIRYGGMREQVLGLEVVLPDGRFLPLGSSLRKDNTGYDLKQLFIGAEGTLGIITAATLKLVSRPTKITTLCFAVDTADNVLRILELSHLSAAILHTFEFFSHSAYRMVLHTNKDLRPLFKKKVAGMVLVELDGEQGAVEHFVSKVFSHRLAEDGVVAQSEAERQMLWSYRELISESLSTYKLLKKGDVSISPPRLSAFLSTMHERLAADAAQDIETVVFGHIADGNLHINFASNNPAAEARMASMDHKMHQLVGEVRGSISAEHGIGLRKKDYLALSRSTLEIELMRIIKQGIDPRTACNPGKIFDV